MVLVWPEELGKRQKKLRSTVRKKNRSYPISLQTASLSNIFAKTIFFPKTFHPRIMAFRFTKQAKNRIRKSHDMVTLNIQAEFIQRDSDTR